MCGIVGYIGNRQALPILLDGLRRLEYRGYDSAGVCVLESGAPFCVRSVGHIENLEKKLAAKNPDATTGIAHTRWATHGEPTEANAHPHADCKDNIYIAHNGIIENHKELRELLEKQGHVFRSETDTEALAHLIEHASGATKSFEDAVVLALTRVVGTFGIVAISRKEPDKLIAARRSSPLILGVGENENLIASDASAILAHTRNVIYLDDNELAVITPRTYRIQTLDRKYVEKTPELLDWSPGEVERGGYPHFMAKEIYEGPRAIENAIRGRILVDEGAAKLGGLEGVEKSFRDIERLIIVSMGTSLNAGLVGECMLEEYAGLSVDVVNASEFRYRKQPFDKKTAVLAISQSGETADTLAALREAKTKGMLTLGIVNVVGSSVARETGAGIYNHAGPEIGVASTKAFISQLSVLALFTLWVGRMRNLSQVMGSRIASELLKLPKLAEKTLEGNASIAALAKKYAKFENFLYLGRKYNFPTALEGALKLKEISYIHAEGYPAGEMKHGPIALIDKNFPTFAIAPQDSVYGKMVSNMEEIRARGGPIIALTTEGNEEITHSTEDILTIPKTLEMLTPALAVIPLQLFAYHMAVLRGCDVDKPRNLAKSVTVE